ncbi:MAG: DUF2339 domain-containing protein [Shewanella sp.]
MPLKDELARLHEELKNLRAAQNYQQHNWDSKLDSFGNKLDQLSLRLAENTSATSIQTPIQHSLAPETLSQLDNEATTQLTSRIQRQTVAEKEAKSDVAHELINQSADQLTNSLGQFSSLLLGPFLGIAHQVKSFYQGYQARGLGPVFLMTLAGIITLTLGFGYLLQYSINHWFTELGKAIFGFTAANTIIGIGILIHKKRPRMQEFASGLVGLGLILNFLCCYFIGPYFGIIPTSISFILLFIITLAGFGLSIKLEAKVVSIITLVGGSLAPMMLVSTSQSPLSYLPYLLLVGCCALIQSRKLRWPALIEVCSLLHIACIEAFMFYLYKPFDYLDWQIALGIISISAIFYLYGFTSILFSLITVNPFSASLFKPNLNKIDNDGAPLSKRLLALPFALMALVLLSISQFTIYNGEIFLLNAIICGGLYVALGTKTGAKIEANSLLRGLMLVLAGSFAGFAALKLISADYLGLILLLEALSLLWLGTKEKLVSVRAEAYVLILLGLIFNVQGLLGISYLNYSLTNVNEYAFPLVILLLSAVSLFIACKLMTKHLKNEEGVWHLFYEAKVWLALKESLSLCYACGLLFIAAVINDEYFINTLPFISILMLHLATKDKLKFTEIFAWLLQLPLVVMIIVGIIDVASFSFQQQPLYAQLARVELFLSLIFAYYWYKSYFRDSKIIKFTAYIQLGCFIILPLLFIPKVINDYENYLSLAIWLSCIISVLLARYVRLKPLILEAKILTVIATIITAVSCLDHQWQGMLALVIGAILMASLITRYKKLNFLSRTIFKFQWQLSPYYFALVAAVLVQIAIQLVQQAMFTHMQLGPWGLIAAVLSAYFAWLVNQKPVPSILKATFSISYALVFICALTPLLLHIGMPITINTENLTFIIAEVISLSVLAWLLLKPNAAVRVHTRSLPIMLLHWSWHILFAVSYMIWSYQLPASFAAPLSAVLLVSHGSWLMFISLRPRHTQIIKLAASLFALTCLKVLFVDMANFEVIQKVCAFMGIGAILLTVSYFYQKARNTQMDKKLAINENL